jgi:predicted nucleic acid-binding protein
VIVADASVAAKWMFPEEQSDLALSLFVDRVRRREQIVAPHLLPIEFTNVVRRRMLRDALSLDDARRALDAFASFRVQLRPNDEAGQRTLQQRALAVAAELGLPATYDAQYLALADSLECLFWTADERLVRAVGGRLPFLRALRDYTPDS